MKVENILEAEQEAKRFLKRVRALRKVQGLKDIDKRTYQSMETSAVKRSSMDLTRSLALMRQDTY
tara:strand:- start:324 stop:518 length:195 start_codon:yes stop_codon:yes gene_type:complete